MTRVSLIAGGLIAAVMVMWSAMAPQAYTADQPLGIASRELVTHFQDQGTGPTAVTVVDPQTRVLAVYHINRETGEVKLKSVRNFDLDLRLSDFNSGSPTPDEIRKMFDHAP